MAEEAFADDRPEDYRYNAKLQAACEHQQRRLSHLHQKHKTKPPRAGSERVTPPGPPLFDRALCARFYSRLLARCAALWNPIWACDAPSLLWPNIWVLMPRGAESAYRLGLGHRAATTVRSPAQGSVPVEASHPDAWQNRAADCSHAAPCTRAFGNSCSLRASLPCSC